MEKVDILNAHEDIKKSFFAGLTLLKHVKRVEKDDGKLKSYSDAIALQRKRRERQEALNACHEHMRIVE